MRERILWRAGADHMPQVLFLLAFVAKYISYVVLGILWS
jgi:hypothetical protein